MMNEKGKAIADILIALVLFVNAILTACGKSPLPLNEDAVTMTICSIASALDIIYVWWRNQNITIEAQTAQNTLNELKASRDLAGGEGDPLGEPEGANDERK